MGTVTDSRVLLTVLAQREVPNMTTSAQRLVVILAIAVVAAWSPASPVAAAGAASTADARLRLDWQIGTRFGRPVIQGVCRQ